MKINNLTLVIIGVFVTINIAVIAVFLTINQNTSSAQSSSSAVPQIDNGSEPSATPTPKAPVATPKPSKTKESAPKPATRPFTAKQIQAKLKSYNNGWWVINESRETDSGYVMVLSESRPGNGMCTLHFVFDKTSKSKPLRDSLIQDEETSFRYSATYMGVWFSIVSSEVSDYSQCYDEVILMKDGD